MSDRRLRVLIVEDEVLVAAELAWLVEDLGHDVVGEAATSADALRLASDTRPDLALVDVHLYDGPTGVEVARRIAAESGATVLFMTANQKRVPPDFAGAAGLVPKPYSIHGMQEAIAFVEQCMAEGRAMAEPPHSLKVAPAFNERLSSRGH